MNASVTLVALAIVAGAIAVWALLAENAVVLIALGVLWLLTLLAWMVRASGDVPTARHRPR